MKIAPTAGDPVVVVASREPKHLVKTGRVSWQGARINVVPDAAAPFVMGERVVLLCRIQTQRMQAIGQYAGRAQDCEQFNVIGDWTPADNREKPRFETTIAVEIFPRGSRQSVKGTATDVSEGGIGVLVDQGLNQVEVDVLMRNGSFSSTLPARVLHESENPSGVHLSIQWDELTGSHRAFLRGLLISLLAQPLARSA